MCYSFFNPYKRSIDMKKNKVFLMALTLICSTTFANTVITQPDKVLGFTGYDGRSIQLQFDFQKPIENGDSVDLMIGDKKVLVIKNETGNKLERFTTRFRFNKDEVITVRQIGKNQSVINYTPTVSSDFVLPQKDSFNTQPRASVVSDELAKAYSAKNGDCIFLFTGISNTGSQVPKSFTAKINGGTVSIQSSERLSTSPFFIIGLNEVAKSCEITAQ